MGWRPKALQAQPAPSELPPTLRSLLQASQGPLLAPVRAEIFGPQRFAEHGQSLGLTHTAGRATWDSPSFFPRLRSNIGMLRQARQALATQAAAGDDVSPASLWLLDNFHLIEAQLLAVHEGLPRHYFRALPVLLGEPLAGLPRIYGVAWAFVAHTDSAFDEDLLVHFLCAYQQTRELRLSEMWALPTTLRVVLVENLRRLAEHLATQQAARELANRCCDHIDAGQAPNRPALDALLHQTEQRGVAMAFLAQMGQRLQDRASGADEGVPAHVRQWLQAVLPHLGELQAQQAAQQTADNLSVSNAVASLRTIGDADWPELVARSSPLMQLMLTAPLFAAEHHHTRDDTLHAIETLARRSGKSEMQVAQALLVLMASTPGAAPQGPATDTKAPAYDAQEAGHWLQGPGQATLAHALGLHAHWRLRLQAARRHAVLPLYLGTIALGTWALVARLLPAAPLATPAPATWAPWVMAGVALLLAVPASETVIALLHRLISESTRPRRLPRLALASGIPAEHRVMVVMPAMLSDAAAISGLVHRLQLHHLANPEAHAQFALLSDWGDADQAQSPRDQPLLLQATAAVAALNARLSQPGDDPAAPRFLLLHRKRRYSRSERRWIGWERKRGKLEQLVAALAATPIDAPGDTRADTPSDAAASRPAFVDLGALSTPAAGTRYVVTLDSDTQLPPGRLRELVGVAAHPSNCPRLAPHGKNGSTRVLSGYGILQPRLVTPLPLPSEDTFFHRMFAGQCGIDPYSAASSEVYQDLFGQGSFTGKGLLHVQAMHAVLGGSLPEDQVLSHDLLEGALVRCAAVTDVTLIEDAPFHAEVAASRVHRWTRGDWQLLPILLLSLLRPARYPLGAVNRWKIVDNLRRSLVAPVSLVLLLGALAGTPALPPLGWTLALVLAAFSAGPLMGALAATVVHGDAVARLHFYRAAALDLLRAAAGGLWHLAMLLPHAGSALDAIVRALYRTVFSRRLMLQWTTAAAAQAAARGDLRSTLRRHWGVPLSALLLGAGLWARGTPHPGWSTALCLLWGAAPLWSWLASRTGLTRQLQVCTPADALQLQAVARDTWRYFERCISADDHHLPPDNLQTQPHEMLAHRTSPTNIGLYLLSVACARQFGWIGVPELLARLQATLATLDRLPRERGHFYNWYDTQTLAPLLPMYVSTVDSGNLSGHLLAVAQACLALAQEDAGLSEAPALQALAQRCQTLAWAADFSFLYHPRRRLLHIGYRVAEQQLDAGFYDLLASESRLTSLLAIAKGDVPVRHWASLGRPFFAVGAAAGLRSWSGSMFEYLMPTLVLAEPHGSVLREACKAALVEQRAYAKAQGVPWGISESAYAGCDYTLAYQYAPQGVPRLALRRTPPDELVVAPYASALAAQLDAHRATLNLQQLQQLGARGALGFIEALDYTPARQSGSDTMTPVHTFMAHHQGMTLVALANVLLGGVAQRWGMANPHIEAVVSLLHERAPREVSRLLPLPAEPPPQAQRRNAPKLQRSVRPGQHAVEPTHLLSNGRYSVALRANGAGRSRCGTQDITRWRDDVLRDAHGSFLWLRRCAPGADPALVSLTQHPAPDAKAEYLSEFHADRVCLQAQWPQMHSRITVWVSPEDDIEFRRVDIHNTGSEVLEVELISALEPTLADTRADEAHPAFSNLFISGRADAPQQALLFERKPRLATETGLHMAHFVAESGSALRELRCQVDRAHWLGRNQAPSAPRGALMPLVASTGSSPDAALNTGLDPVCVLGARLRIAPGSQARVTFATAASSSAATLQAVVDKYRQASHIERAVLMSATLAGVRLHALRIGAGTFNTMQTLTTALMFTLTRPPSAVGVPGALHTPQMCDRRLLWRLGISGDKPVLLVSAATLPGLGLVRSLSQAMTLWAWGGVACDLVVVNSEAASYEMALQRELAALRDRHDADAAARLAGGGTASTGWFLLRAEDLSSDELSTLQTLARLRLLADGRSLGHHLNEWAGLHEVALQTRQDSSHSTLPVAAAPAGDMHASQGVFASGTGNAGEFQFDVSALLRPLRPWVNVLANPGFGTQVSEAGGGCTWAVNSRLNQLTPWSNDALADAPGEWLLLQDRHSREVWSLPPSAHGALAEVHTVTHGQGYSVVQLSHAGLDLRLTWCVDPVTAVKQVQLRVTNRSARTRHLRWVGLCEWLLGAQRSDRASVHTTAHNQRLPAGRLTALLATQQERAAGFGGGTAFLATLDVADDGTLYTTGEHGGIVSETRAGLFGNRDSHRDADIGSEWTCDRREFVDARGRPVLPDHLGRQAGAGSDPCAALALRLDLPPGQSTERCLLLGWAASPDEARQLAARAAAVAPARRLRAARQSWDTLLDHTEVKTPDPLFDALVNRWLPYQTVACRLWAKAGFYQAGGATGFRDQLQDAMSLAWSAPDLLRAQIARCAARQFAQGDVQHWWHDPQGAGVRTHFSDDLLWLPYALAHYLQRSGDTSLLDEWVPFIEGPPIPQGAEDLYSTPAISLQDASIYEHAARTLDLSLRVGAHGLPLMGSGDWNDGMNRVGHGGRGESVWLAWFLCRVVADFGPLARARGDTERAQRWDDAAAGWRSALQGPAWDGQWYARAFFDDGQVLGSHHNSEARIDLVAQAWAVLSGVAPPDRQAQALAAVQTHLVDHDAGLVRLLHPPLALAVPSAGYIQAYPPGVRENGGQYSHAGVWALMAQAALAKTLADPQPALDEAWQTFLHLSPAHRAAHPTQGPVYGVEPYVVAGDVYTAPPWVGRGGWSWYTGAAAWLHRAAMESILGLQLDALTLRVAPGLPSHWPEAEVTLRRAGGTLHLRLLRISPKAALALAAADAQGLQVLLPGGSLVWKDLPAAARCVVPLGAAKD